MARVASRQDILSAKDWDTKEFDVERWGTVRIRSLSAKERLDLVKSVGGVNADIDPDKAVAFQLRLIAMSMIDDDGDAIFDPTSDEDIAALQTRSGPRLEKVAKEILRFNGLDNDEASEKN